MEFERPDVVDRGHGDRHGARHRHAPYRPLGRIDHWLRLDDHWRGAGSHPADLSRPRQSGDLDHRRHPCFGGRRGDRRLSRLARRLSRHSGFHRHARGPVVLARRRMVGDGGPDDRAARRPLRADGRWSAWLGRSDRELDHRWRLLRRHRVRSLCRPSATGALSFSSAADVGGIRHRDRRLFRRPRRDRDRQFLSVARAGRGAIRGGQPYPRAGRRPVHFHRLRDSGSDRARDRPRHDLPREADPVRPLCLRHRRQPGSRRACRRQHQANHDSGLRADGRAGGHRRLHRFGAARTRRPTCSGSSTSFT